MIEPNRDQRRLMSPKKPSAALRRAGKGKRKSINIGSAWKAIDSERVQAFARQLARM